MACYGPYAGASALPCTDQYTNPNTGTVKPCACPAKDGIVLLREPRTGRCRSGRRPWWCSCPGRPAFTCPGRAARDRPLAASHPARLHPPLSGRARALLRCLRRGQAGRHTAAVGRAPRTGALGRGPEVEGPHGRHVQALVWVMTLAVPTQQKSPAVTEVLAKSTHASCVACHA